MILLLIPSAAPCAVPREPQHRHRTLDGLCHLEEVDGKTLEKHCESAIGRCPGNHDRLDTVGWAFDARDSRGEDGLELTGIEMPPLAFLTVVVTGELLLAIRATKLRSSKMFHPDTDLLRFDVKFHLRNAPRRMEAENMLVEFFVLLLRGPFPFDSTITHTKPRRTS